MKRLLYILIPVLMPYMCVGFIFLTLYTKVGEILNNAGVIVPLVLLITVIFGGIISLAGAIVTFVLMTKNKLCSKSAAGLTLILKFLHIPAHLCCAFLGWMLLIWMGMGFYFFAISLFSITTSGIVSTYSLIKGRFEGKLSSFSALIRIIFSYIFVLDVFFAVASYIRLRKAHNKSSAGI